MTYQDNTPPMPSPGPERDALAHEAWSARTGTYVGDYNPAKSAMAHALRSAARILRAVRDEHGADSVAYTSARLGACPMASTWLIEFADGAVDYRLAPHMVELMVEESQPIAKLWPDESDYGDPGDGGEQEGR